MTTITKISGQPRTVGRSRLAHSEREDAWRALAILGALLPGPLSPEAARRLILQLGGGEAFARASRLAEVYLPDDGAELRIEIRALRRSLDLA